MKEKQQEQQIEKKSIFIFPEKLNNIALFGLLMLYSLVLGIVAVAISPVESYIVTPKYEHNIENEEIQASDRSA